MFSRVGFTKLNTMIIHAHSLLSVLKKKNSPNLVADLHTVIESGATKEMAAELKMLAALLHHSEYFIKENVESRLQLVLGEEIKQMLHALLTELGDDELLGIHAAKRI